MTTTSVNVTKNERNGHLKAFDLVFSKTLLQVPHKLQNCLKVSHFHKKLVIFLWILI